MDVAVGDLVRSISGRDAGKLFFVLGYNKQYVFLADGRVRKLEKPKKKKMKHVNWLQRPQDAVSERLRFGAKVTNKELRKSISQITEAYREGIYG